jgi:phosphoribosylformylglycinamidine synthase subunit PurS
MGKEQVKAKIHITLKPGVLDPQGKAIAGALHHLGFDGVGEVRQGKFIEVELKGSDRKKAHDAIDSMCQKLLANTVIENYRFDIE